MVSNTYIDRFSKALKSSRACCCRLCLKIFASKRSRKVRLRPTLTGPQKGNNTNTNNNNINSNNHTTTTTTTNHNNNNNTATNNDNNNPKGSAQKGYLQVT